MNQKYRIFVEHSIYNLKAQKYASYFFRFSRFSKMKMFFLEKLIFFNGLFKINIVKGKTDG